MKKVLVTVLVLAVGLALGSMAYAAWGGGYGPGSRGQVDTKALRNFQKETLPLRDEMAAKGLDLQNEYAKENPDRDRIDTLQKEMIDLRTKIQESAQKQGLADSGPGWMMGQGGWGHGSMMGQGGWGHGAMMGRGGYGSSDRGGYGSGYCPMW